jgi:hypothetical protein
MPHRRSLAGVDYRSIARGSATANQSDRVIRSILDLVLNCIAVAIATIARNATRG